MQRPHLPLLLCASALCIALLGAAVSARATSPDWSTMADDPLEQLFWDCDARSTQEMLSAGDGALCVDASDELKRRRFGGDFGRLLAWWQANKAAEHARRLGPADAEELALQAP